MKPPEAVAPISHAKHADLAAVCVAAIARGAGILLLNHIISKKSP